MIVAIDIDGVVAELHTEWYRRYNKDYSDNLSVARVLTWDTHRYVKPECGKKIYDYLTDPDLYDNVKPIDGALEHVKWLRENGHRVVFVSACVPGSMDSKARWLMREGFVPSKNGHPEGLILTTDKDLVRAHMLIDDAPKNIETWTTLPVVFDAPYNQNINKANARRLKGWYKLPELMEKIYA